MKPTFNDIIQIIPAPANLRAVYLDSEESKEFCEPVAALALVAVDDGLGGTERDVRALGASDIGLDFADSCENFVRLQWSVRKPCQCSKS
ncbi:MAG: hypothetical protein C0622_06610 [Desulfuromonas sp.]|nr:MAG: hypothetical protein C0622_06610 [Desulfuromonas sp.]